MKFTTKNFIIDNFMNKCLGKVKSNFLLASSIQKLTYRTIQRTNYHLTNNSKHSVAMWKKDKQTHFQNYIIKDMNSFLTVT